MIKEKIKNLNEGDEFYFNSYDEKPNIFLKIDDNRIIYFDPDHGYKSVFYEKIKWIYTYHPADQAWKEAKKKHGTWNEVAKKMKLSLPTIKKMRDSHRFPVELYNYYGFYITRRSKKNL